MQISRVDFTRFSSGYSSRLLRRKRKMKCREKEHYETFGEAQQALDEYRASILFSNMVVYPCRQHGGFHKGHDRFMNDSAIIEREMHSSILGVISSQSLLEDTSDD